MPSGPTEAAQQPELPVLLSGTTLYLAPEVRTAHARAGLLVAKNVADRRYLFMKHEHWQLLKRFADGQTVPDVLCDIISENRCPPLRDFYELVMKAHESGILLTKKPATTAQPFSSANWRVGVAGPIARMSSAVVIVCSATILLSARVQMPAHVTEIVISCLLAVAAGSLGQVLAACVLHGAGCAVYRPRFDWKTPAPRFRVDLDDAVMGGRDTEVDAALVRLAPSFFFAAAAALKAPAYYLPLLAGVFVQLSPLWPTPMLDLLRALFRDPRLSTSTRFIFASSRPAALLSQARQQFSDRKYLLAGITATVIWLGLVFVIGCVLVQANAVDLLHRFYAAGGLRDIGLVIVGVLAAGVLGVLGLVMWIIVSHVRAWWREGAERRRRLAIAVTSPEEVAQLLAGTVLFRDLPPETLQAVAAAMRPEDHPRGDYVIRLGEEADRLFVLVSGRLEVMRRLEDGKDHAVAEMIPGDVLGEIAVVRGGTRTRSVRCATRCVLLALDKPDFEKLVLSRVTRAAVEEAVQKVGFLQNIELVKNWPQPALAAFARLAKIQEYSPGDIVMREGEDNLFLHLVHRGEFEVTQRGKHLRKLRQGDSFGELGMLQNSAPTASVTATLPGSCLIIPKSEFLKFITQDVSISLQFEQIGSKRLGRQVFSSHKGPGFDVMRG